MPGSTTPARWLAIVSGGIAAGAAVYVLTQDAIASGHWSSDDVLLPVLVLLTILATHLIGSAIRDRAWLSCAGFVLLAALGTSLVVYTSVGRQARVADTEDAQAQNIATRILKLDDEVKRIERLRLAAEGMLEAARREHARECHSGVGKRCSGIQATIDVYTAAIKGHDADLTRVRREMADVGPVPIVGSKASRMASLIAIFARDEITTQRRLSRTFRLFEPVALSMFWELGALVAFAYGFGHGRRRPALATANDNITSPPSNSGTRQFAPVAQIPTDHPVIVALHRAGRPLSNGELAGAMRVTKGEASKRWREVEGQLAVTRDGRTLRIALAP